MNDDDLLKAIDIAVGQNNLPVAKELGLMLKQNRMRNEPLPQYPLGQEGMPAAIKSTIGEQFGKPAQVLAGAGAAPMVAGHAAANLAGADNDAAMQNWKAVSNATPHTTGGNLAGNVAMFGALPAGAVGAGMNMAGRTLPRLGAVADMAGTQGGLAVATTPGEASDRLMAGALGVGGMAVPGAVGAVQGTRRAVTKQGKQIGLAEGLRSELGREADTLETALQGRYPGQSYGVSPTSAMLTRNPTLEVLETGSRVRTPDQWTQFDRLNAAARWKALEEAAGSPQELQRLKAARDAITTPLRDKAIGANTGELGQARGTFFNTGRKLENLDATLNDLATGTNRPNRDVQTMVAYVKGEIEKGASPEQLYTIRKMLTDGIAAGPTSELSQAARAARPQRMEIIGKIDDALNDMSEGRWTEYLETYKISSPLITSREAMGKIRDRLNYGRPEGEVPASMGERPSSYAMGRLLEQHGSKMYGSKDIDRLIPQHRQLAETLVSDLNAQAGVMQPRATLGSPTAGNLANAGRVSQLTNSMIDAAGNAIPVAGGSIAASAKGSMARMNEEALAELLRNPEQLSATLRQARAAAELLRRSGRVGAGASAGYRSRGE